MRHFTVGPPLTLKGRKLKGIRGYAGKPFHPPLTDVPVTAYLFAAVFDVLSVALHSGHPAVAGELFHAATWVLLGGAAVSLVTVLVLVDLIVRLAVGDSAWIPAGLMAVTVIAAILVCVGATYGGSMVYDYGFNVETSGDHPVWHQDERDVRPGEKEPRGAATGGSGSVTTEPS